MNKKAERKIYYLDLVIPKHIEEKGKKAVDDWIKNWLKNCLNTLSDTRKNLAGAKYIGK